MVGAGLRLLFMDKEELWRRQEHRFRAQGIVNRQKTPEWERAQDNGAWLSVGLGALMVIGAMIVMVQVSSVEASRRDALRSHCSVDGKEVSCDQFPFLNTK